MNNLVIASSTLAGGSLVLLGTGVKADTSFVVAGVIILIINVAVVFGFQFYQHGKDNRNFEEFITRKISPVADLLGLYADYESAKMKGEDVSELGKNVDTKIMDVALALKKFETENHTRLAKIKENSPYRNHWDKLFMGILTLAFLCIIWGLMSPYLLSYNNQYEQKEILRPSSQSYIFRSIESKIDTSRCE